MLRPAIVSTSFHVAGYSFHGLHCIQLPLVIGWHSRACPRGQDPSVSYVLRIQIPMSILFRRFLFSQLFESLTVSSRCRFNWMTKDCLLTEPMHDPSVACSRAILVARAAIGSHLVTFNWPSRVLCKVLPDRHAREEVRLGLILEIGYKCSHLFLQQRLHAAHCP